MAKVTRFFTVFLAVLLGLYVWAATAPSHYNWGLHYFAFYPVGWSAAALLAGILVLVPVVRSALLSWLSGVVRFFGGFHPASILLLLLVVGAGMLYLFPVKLHLLGDSELILQLTPKLPSIEDVSANFRNQPLTYQALRLVQWFTGGGGGAVEPMTLYRIADGIAGILFIGALFHFLRVLSIPNLDAVLVGALLFSQAATQFFFGYVENYMLFYVALTAYLLTGWLALAGKGPLWLPLVILAVVPWFHIAGVIFLPSAVFLLLPLWTGRPKIFLAGMAGVVLAGVFGVLLLEPSWLTTRVGDALRNDLLPVTSSSTTVPYGMFSTAHLIDWTNALLHCAPFSLVCIAVGAATLPRKEYTGSPVFQLLAGSAAIGLITTFVILPALGMARDWDMLSNFFLPLPLLSAYFLILLLRAREMRHAVLMLAVFAVVRWAGWIGINADEDRHIARAEMLTVPELSGTFPKIYYENLGNTFNDRKDFRHAAKWYERYMNIDSTHPRILANLSDCYRALGDSANVFRMLRLSVDAKSTNAGVYSNLAVEYVNRGDTARGIALLNEALNYDPGHFESLANLSILNLQTANYPEALRHSVEAIRLGMRDPVLYKNAGYASYFLSDYPGAVIYFDEYLKSAPADANVRGLFDELRRRLGTKSPVGGNRRRTAARSGGNVNDITGETPVRGLRAPDRAARRRDALPDAPHLGRAPVRFLSVGDGVGGTRRVAPVDGPSFPRRRR